MVVWSRKTTGRLLEAAVTHWKWWACSSRDSGPPAENATAATVRHAGKTTRCGSRTTASQRSARACLPNIHVLTSEDWAVTRIGVISDEFWAAVESVMPSDEGKRGNRFGDHRLILEGIERFRTGSPWRDLPADFGPWQTVWKRHHRWSLDGTYDEMFAQVAAVFGVRRRDGRGHRDVAVGGFDERAGTSTLRGCVVRHACHRGHCRITRKPPMSPTTTRSAAREAGSLRRSTQ